MKGMLCKELKELFLVTTFLRVVVVRVLRTNFFLV